MKFYKQLSTDERNCLQFYFMQKRSMCEIAGLLGRNVSTISREIKRNGNKNGSYHFWRATSLYKQLNFYRSVALDIKVYQVDSNTPISVAPGMAFDGGIFIEPLYVPYPTHEEIAIEVRFPEHPDIVFKLFLDYLKQDSSPMFTNVGIPSENILRHANTTIDGNPAQEFLKKFQRNDVTYYSFSLNSPSKKSNVYQERIPQITMYLTNPTGGVVRDGISTQHPLPKRSSFASDEEAMAFWDAIRKSMRWRPNGERGGESPDRHYYIIDEEIVLGPPIKYYPPR